jgi:putative hydrolase of the HAD superfamily
MRFAEVDAVTVDGYGTLLTLAGPIPALRRALGRYGIERLDEEVATAFAAEASHYRPRAHLGRDEPSLAALRLECTGVFLQALDASVDPADFVADFIGALQFEAVPGAVAALSDLRSRGLKLAVVANWDSALPEHLARMTLDRYFSAVITSAEAGAPKPDPAPFRLALERLGVDATRAVHVGDEQADELGAAAAGMHFVPAPLALAFRDWE